MLYSPRGCWSPTSPFWCLISIVSIFPASKRSRFVVAHLHERLRPFEAITNDVLSLQVALNTVWSLLCLAWELQTLLIFGQLRSQEQKVLSECFWQYLLLKLVFLGVILDPSVYQGAVWSAVLLVSGFGKMGLLLAQERVQHLASREAVAKRDHWSLFLFTVASTLGNIGWIVWLLKAFYPGSHHSVVVLMVVEPILNLCQGAHVLMKHAFLCCDVPPGRGTSSSERSRFPSRRS